LALRYGNAIVRGTYVTGRDSGNRDSFREAYGVSRGGGQFGLLKDDRESSFGVNAEVFLPKPKMGIFARYGHYNNLDANLGGDTYGGGISFLDVFSTDDRLGLAYGNALSNENLRRQQGLRKADALELFYDFRFMPNLRVGFSLQQRNDFSEVVAGVRVKTEFDVTPKGRLFQ
jgi:Carbohydrate-selective porin, OprB family